MTAVVKALLIIHKPVKMGSSGYRPGAPVAEIPFQFNPAQLSLQGTAQRTATPSGGSVDENEPTTFLGANPRTLGFDMLIDGTEFGSPQALIAAVEGLFSALEAVGPSSDGKGAVQPFVRFQWGKPFVGTLQSVSVTYTLFNASGMPLRAECSISIEERRDGSSAQNPTSGSLLASKRRTVSNAAELALLAAEDLGDSGHWRAIAAYNGIDDPMRIGVATSVLVPDRSELNELMR